MKLLHLSDLHLGKKVFEFSMLEDQKYILDRILEIADAERVAGVLLAGDLYDRQVPSAEAVRLLDSFLTRLSERGIRVFAVSGNHDSAERLSFGASLMGGAGVYFSPVYDGTVRKVSLRDEYGETAVWLLPFIRPSAVRQALEEETVASYQDAVRAALARFQPDPEARNILVAHQFVTGAERSESEEVQAGGLDNVDASLFDAFDYVALGHIHKPQWIGRRTLRYCGTPLKYSFSEANQEKSVTVVELGRKGDVEVRTLPLKPLKDMREIRGTYQELMNRSFYQGTNTEDYIQAVLTDEEDVPDAMQRLRTTYPNLMHLSYDNRRTRENRQAQEAVVLEGRSELSLFQEFFELQNNRPMDERQSALAEGLLEKLKEVRE